ncbi:MAG: hypothetical protein E7638_00445 [Ruminococcaceae bacterium]|nr:hypothetical protein [Oscillospiraceae bacterium]
MGMKKRLLGVACTILAASAIAQTTIANIPETNGKTGLFSAAAASVDSRIVAGCTLTEEEAALRLYYLGMITGTGTNGSGGVDFALDRGLSRLEAAVFAVRLMGAEVDAEEANYAHPYSDVPEWASAYIGYMYNRGLLNFIGDRQYRPNAAVSCDEFMSYVLHALGYRLTERDYTLTSAASIARKAKICTTDEDEALTRGGACIAMYNALRATMKDSDKILSNKLVESGEIGYEAAIFLLWSENKEETEKYMAAAGYGKQWIIPDGYYTITANSNGKNLNVAASGNNADYEGVGVTLWDKTEDATQSFRLERTERGTYLIYSAASKSGFGRVIGTSAETGNKAGLYQSTSKNAMEYYIEGSVDGSWTIVSADNANLALSCSTPDTNGAAVTLEERGKAANQTWDITKHGITNASGEDMAIFCCNSLSVTQGAYDIYSHQNQNALDIQPTEGKAFAPFHATVVAVDPTEIACNAVWIESISPVRYADGTYDYMTVCFMHDNDISDLYVGKGLKQGDWFYDSGTAGISSGAHIHVAVYKGKYSNTMHVGYGNVNAEDAFFLLDNTYIRDDYGLDWVVISSAK